MELLNHRISLCLAFWRVIRLLSKVGTPLTSPPTKYGCFSFSTFSPTVVDILLLKLSCLMRSGISLWFWFACSWQLVLFRILAPHSSTLAWKIPWTEEPGRLQSVGLLRVGHDWVTSLSLSCIGEGNGNPLQCSCLENPRDRGAWWAAVYGVAQSWTWLKWLSSSSMCLLICWKEHWSVLCRMLFQKMVFAVMPTFKS